MVSGRTGAHGSMSIAAARWYFIAVWLAYCVAAFLLARHGSLHPEATRWTPRAFAALALAAFAGYWHALAASVYLRPRSLYRHLGLAVLAFAGLFFSTLCWAFFVTGAYGN